MHRLKDVLSAATILTGLDVPSDQRAKIKARSDVLKDRLTRFSQATSSIFSLLHQQILDYLHHHEQDAKISNLRSLIAKASLACLSYIDRALSDMLNEEHSPSSSTNFNSNTNSGGENIPPPPTLSIRDSQVIKQLATFISIWGLMPQLTAVTSTQETQKEQPKIVELHNDFPEEEIEEQEEAVTKLDLSNTIYELFLIIDPVVRNGSRPLPVSTHGADFLPLSQGDQLTLLPSLIVPSLHTSLIAALLQVGYAPRKRPSTSNLAPDECQVWARQAIVRLICMVDSTTAFDSLFAVFPGQKAKSDTNQQHQSTTTTTPTPPKSFWSFKPVTFLLNFVLAQPYGVRGYLLYITSQGETDAPMELIDTSAKLIMAQLNQATPPPSQSKGRDSIIQLFEVIQAAAAPFPNQQTPPPTILAAATQIISILLHSSSKFRTKFLSNLHHSFFPVPSTNLAVNNQRNGDDFGTIIIAHQSLYTSIMCLSLLTENVDPSEEMQNWLVSPIATQLFGLYVYLSTQENKVVQVSSSSGSKKNDDVDLKNTTLDILIGWGKHNESELVVKEIIRTIFLLETNSELEQYNGKMFWARDDINSQVCIRFKAIINTSEASLFDYDDTEDLLQIRPEPKLIMDWLKSLDKQKELIGGRLLLEFLNDLKKYSDRQVDDFILAKRAVVRMELINNMVEQLGTELLSSSTDIIEFVEFTMDITNEEKEKEKNKNNDPTSTTSKMQNLKIVEEIPNERDEDTQEQGQGQEQGEEGTKMSSDELFMTGISLLLAVLERNPNLDKTTSKRLYRIEKECKRVSSLSSTSSVVSSVAGEAQRVLHAQRMLSSSLGEEQERESKTRQGHEQEQGIKLVRESYTQATKLLTQSEVPSRAQGLAQLRALYDTPEKAKLLENAHLVDKIKEIMLSSIEEEDSFIYLSAIQGVSLLADMFGIRIIGDLVSVCCDRTILAQGDNGSNGDHNKDKFEWSSEQGRRELDKRSRVAESLLQIVQKSGGALSIFADVLVDGMLGIVGDNKWPTLLRTSALGILEICIYTSIEAVVRHIDALLETCLTVLQLVSVSKESQQPQMIQVIGSDDDFSQDKGAQEEDIFGEDDQDLEKDIIISTEEQLKKARQKARYDESIEPTSLDTKHPSLRRAVLVLLQTILGQNGLEWAYDRQNILERVHTIVGYVSQTDVDGIVRQQAQQIITQLNEDE